MTNWFDQRLVRNVALAPNQVWHLARRTCCLKASSIGRIIVADLSVVMAMVYECLTSFSFFPRKYAEPSMNVVTLGLRGLNS